MKRRGFILAEALLALGILSMLATATFPFIGRVGEAVTTVGRQKRCREEALFSAQYIAEAARFALARTTAAEQISSDSYSFKRKSDNYGIQTYGFSVSGGVLRFQVYEGGAQPLTGDTDAVPEYVVRHGERVSYFMTEPGGLLHISYNILRRESGETFHVETAVFPLYDFLRVGENFE